MTGGKIFGMLKLAIWAKKLEALYKGNARSVKNETTGTLMIYTLF